MDEPPKKPRSLWPWVLVCVCFLCALAGVRVERYAQAELEYAKQAPTELARADALGFAASNRVPWGGAAQEASNTLRRGPAYSQDRARVGEASSRHIANALPNPLARLGAGLGFVLFLVSCSAWIVVGFTPQGQRTRHTLKLGASALASWVLWLSASYFV